jgi:hypothetical protein
VNADALPADALIVAVRLWLLVRSDTPEVGFIDNGKYVYGDRTFEPSRSEDAGLSSPQHYRRLLVSKTIQVRNALSF